MISITQCRSLVNYYWQVVQTLRLLFSPWIERRSWGMSRLSQSLLLCLLAFFLQLVVAMTQIMMEHLTIWISARLIRTKRNQVNAAVTLLMALVPRKMIRMVMAWLTKTTCVLSIQAKSNPVCAAAGLPKILVLTRVR